MIVYTQNIEDATLAVVTGTAHASYPVDNLASLVKNKTFRTASGSSVVPEITIDLGSARACNYLLLGGMSSGIYGGGDFINLYCGSTDNGSTWDINTVVDASIGYENKVFTFNSVSKRYWKIAIEEMDNNAADYISHIFLGTYYELPNSGEQNNLVGYNYDNVTAVNNNAYQQRYAIGDRRAAETSLTVRGFTEAQKDAFIAHFETYCSGTLKPFYFTRDDRSTVTFGHFTNNPFTFRRITKDFYETTLDIMEQL